MGVIEIYSPSVSAADHPCLAGVLRCPPSRDGLQCISPHASGLPAQARMPTGRGMPLTPPSVLVKARELEKARELKEWALLDELPKCTGRGIVTDATLSSKEAGAAAHRRDAGGDPGYRSRACAPQLTRSSCHRSRQAVCSTASSAPWLFPWLVCLSAFMPAPSHTVPVTCLWKC